MQKLKSNQAGSGIVEVILVIIVVGLIGSVSWYVWHGQQAKSTNQPATQSSSSKSQSGLVNLADAASFVKRFYDEYDNKSTSVDNGQINTIKKYGTSNLLFYYNYYQHGFDPIVCAQISPDSNTSNAVKTSNGVADVDLVQKFENGSSTVHVQVVYRGGLKIDSVACPGAEANLPAPPPTN